MTLQMSAEQPGSRPLRNLVRIGGNALVAIGAAWFVYVRCTTPPAGERSVPAADGAGPELRVVLEGQVEGLLRALPDPHAVLPAVAADVMLPAAFGVDPGQPWLEASWTGGDLRLIAALAYLDVPEVVAAMQELAAWCDGNAGRFRRIDPPRSRPVSVQAPAPIETLETATALFALRARRHAAEDRLAAAVADLKASFRLMLLGERSRTWWNWSAGSPVFELGCLARERDLPPDTVNALWTFLHDEIGMSAAEEAGRHFSLDVEVEQLLNRHYTRSADGGGWLVLSSLRTEDETADRSAAWNALSFVFRGRRAIAHKLETFEQTLAELDRIGFPTAADRLKQLRPDALDGPLAARLASIGRQQLEAVVQRVSRRRALLPLLGLSAYRHDHGANPADLDALVPGYLPERPIDAYAAKPFRYKLREKKDHPDDPDFLLRSYDVQPDQVWWGSAYSYHGYVPVRPE